jgi:hypothetical protein
VDVDADVNSCRVMAARRLTSGAKASEEALGPLRLRLEEVQLVFDLTSSLHFYFALLRLLGGTCYASSSRLRLAHVNAVGILCCKTKGKGRKGRTEKPCSILACFVIFNY